MEKVFDTTEVCEENVIIQDLREKITLLDDKLGEMYDFFEKQSEAIINKCVKNIVAVFRKKPLDISLLTDDFDELSFFNQLCIVARRGDLFDYMGIEMYIEGLCSQEFNELSSDEQFILENRTEEEQDSKYDIKIALYDYLSKYSNKKIEDYE